MNLFAKKNILLYLTGLFVLLAFSSSLYSQEAVIDNKEKNATATELDEEIDDTIPDSDQVMKLDNITIQIEPIRPTIELKRREIKPKDYTFFRSFEKEVQQVPNDLLRIRFNTGENRIDNLKKILSKKRK